MVAPFRLSVVFGTLSISAAQLAAQAAPTPVTRVAASAPGRFTVANPRANAIADFEAGLEAEHALSFAEAYTHASAALAQDSTFGLARALHARRRGGPTLAAEMNRAASDAARGPAAEALLVLGMREGAAGRTAQARAIFDALTTMVPNDPRIAVEAALSQAGQPRVDALRDVARRFPDYVQAKYQLAYYLTPYAPFSVRPLPEADATEAQRVAEEAVRQAPNASGSHTVLGHVLMRTGKHDEALRHLERASSLGPANPAPFVSRGEILMRVHRPAEARAALDSAILLHSHIGQTGAWRQYRAFTFLAEGNLPATIAALEENLRDAETKGAVGVVNATHISLAHAHAAGRNSAAVDRHLAHAQRGGLAPAALADATIITSMLTGRGAMARAALSQYIEASQAQEPAVREENIQRMTGLTLLAENKPVEAIPALRKGGWNAWCNVGLIEAYTLMGRKKEVEAERAAMLARRDYAITATSVPIVMFRASPRNVAAGSR